MAVNVKALYQITYGVYAIGSQKDGKLNAQIANTLIQVCADPPTVSVCINKQNLTHEYITASKVFTASILAQETPLRFIGNLGFKSGREMNKMEGVNYKVGVTKAPIVMDNALSTMEVQVTNQMDAGTHTIFVGTVIASDVVRDGTPMTYAYYHEVKRGTLPPTAPHYVEEAKVKVAKVVKYKCQVCGWIYDPSLGDPDGNIAPGTPFEKIPDSWVCPVCGASKDMFNKIED
jgi:flavin reductase (DIM6/NTAB) family NADH-FMN oxidoreductase RutF/rubredoxin